MKNIYFHKFCSYMYYTFSFPYLLCRILPTNIAMDVECNIRDWFIDRSLDVKICEECVKLKKCTFSGNSYDSVYDDVNVFEVYDCWHEIFDDVCYSLGFNRKSAKVLWENLSQENWEHLHQTEKEKQYTEKEWFDEFYLDVFYCSDRWSFTRLERCHWKFKQWTQMIEGDAWKV